MLPSQVAFFLQLRRPHPRPLYPRSAKTLLLTLLPQGWGELCVVSAQKEGQLCLAWVSSERGCPFFLGSWKVPRQSHKEKQNLLKSRGRKSDTGLWRDLLKVTLQVTAGAGLRHEDPQLLGCTLISSLKPTQTKANQDRKMIRLRKLYLILRMAAAPDDNAGSKNNFLKLYRR